MPHNNIDALFKGNYNDFIDAEIDTQNTLDLLYRAVIYERDDIFEYLLDQTNITSIQTTNEDEVMMLDVILGRINSLAPHDTSLTPIFN